MGEMSQAEEKTAALLAALWVKVRPMVEERLATLDAAAAAAASGGLGEAQRAEACGAAHKLAGSLGMYGFDEGTAVARKIEVLLGEAAPDGARLKGLSAELRRAVFPGE
jgi:HPt (histidine-containing phosphotransfer) domain-containing protein